MNNTFFKPDSIKSGPGTASQETGSVKQWNNVSKIITYTAVIVLFCLAGGFAVAFADSHEADGAEDPVVYLQFDYYVLQAGVAPEFVAMKEKFWKPVHEERIRDGAIIGWSLYDALIKGPTADYDFVAITMTEDYGALYGATDRDLIARVHPQRGTDPLIETMHEGYRVVHSEIWRMNGAALPEGADSPAGKYITKNYMDSRGASGEHESMELDFWKPIHYVRIDQNILNSWVMYTKVKPGGSSIRYNYSTIDYYDRLSDIEGSVGMELARIAHPDLSDEQLSDFFTRTSASRTAYKTELWREVVAADRNP